MRLSDREPLRGREVQDDYDEAGNLERNSERRRSRPRDREDGKYIDRSSENAKGTKGNGRDLERRSVRDREKGSLRDQEEIYDACEGNKVSSIKRQRNGELPASGKASRYGSRGDSGEDMDMDHDSQSDGDGR